MTWLIVVLASMQPPTFDVGDKAPPEPTPAGRVYTSPALHVGVRPAFRLTNDGPEVAVGVTVQVSGFVF